MKFYGSFPRQFLTFRTLLFAFILACIALLEVGLYAIFFGKSVHIYEKFLHPINFAFWVPIVPVIYASLRKYPIQPPYRFCIIRHLLIAVILLFVHRALVELMLAGVFSLYDSDLALLYIPWFNWRNFFIRVTGGSLSNAILYFLTFASLMAFMTYQKYKEEWIRRTAVEQEKSQAELRALKMQLQPHFFFNTLHCLSGLMEENISEAQDYVGRLGDLFRYTLEHGDQDLVKLQFELEFVENYLSIQAIRFRDRLNIEIKAMPETLEILVPSFILQPLIENAIKYGVSQSLSVSQIDVETEIRNTRLQISVKNSVDPNLSGNSGTGLGLSSIKSRLNILYGNDHSFKTERHDQIFEVKVSIPIQRKTHV